MRTKMDDRKYLRFKFVAIRESMGGVVYGWFVRLLGIRNDGATFGAWIVLEDEYAEGVTFDNIRSKTFEDLRRTLDGMLSEPFD